MYIIREVILSLFKGSINFYSKEKVSSSESAEATKKVARISLKRKNRSLVLSISNLPLLNDLTKGIFSKDTFINTQQKILMRGKILKLLLPQMNKSNSPMFKTRRYTSIFTNKSLSFRIEYSLLFGMCEFWDILSLKTS